MFPIAYAPACENREDFLRPRNVDINLGHTQKKKRNGNGQWVIHHFLCIVAMSLLKDMCLILLLNLIRFISYMPHCMSSLQRNKNLIDEYN